MNIVKRDGRKELLDLNKVVKAVDLAVEALCNGNVATEDADLGERVAEAIKNDIKDNMHIDQIQDLVVKALMDRDKDVAQAYVIYKDKRDIARGKKTFETFMSIVEVQANDVTRENANMNADTPAGQMMKFASETTKPFVDSCLVRDEVKRAVFENFLHMHDKDYYPTKSTTCVQHPMENILYGGFRAGHGASRPAKRIETASIQCCISLESSQNEQHGGQAIPALDFYLSPFVKSTFQEQLMYGCDLMNYDYMLVRDWEVREYSKMELGALTGKLRIVQWAINRTIQRVHQAMEAFIHNMNTIHSRGGNQVVFSSINFGTDFSPEGRCIIKEYLICTYEGVGNGETAIFPISIWKKKRGVNYLPTDPNYDLYQLACKVSAKRFFPNFLNLDATFNRHDKWDINDPKRYLYECATMGCRTRVFENRFGDKTSIGRGNLSFSTVNIVGLALEAMKLYPNCQESRLSHFYALLGKYLDLTAEQLHDRFKFQGSAYAKQFPLLMSKLWKDGDKLSPNDTVAEVLKHGTLGIGFIGLAECLTALCGKHHGESDEAQELGLEIVNFMSRRIKGYADEYDLNYSLLATPAEGLSGRFTKKDKKKYGIVEGVTDKDYYTNSSHVPVGYKCSMEHKAKIESPYHDLERGGHIFYTEIDGDATHNPKSVEAVVDLMDEYNMGYGSVNHKKYRCMYCGKETSQEGLEACPECGGDLDVLERITGYLVGGTDRWNDAKLAELKDRVVHY